MSKTNGFKNSRQYRAVLAKLLAQDGRPRSRQTRHRGGKRIATIYECSKPDLTFWVVSGGQQTHTVVWRNNRWECTSEHFKRAGQMCSHEFAVYRALACEQIIQGAAPK